MPSKGKGGGALRSIDEHFQVNPSSGTLSLSIPLPTTPSRGGFQPSLSLTYDSGGGNSPFGVGWGIPIEAVQRKTSHGVPAYDDNDVFLLSGADDLVPSDTKPEQAYGCYMVRTYQPRVEDDASRIERFSNINDSSDVYWRTISPSNITKIFGRTNESRLYNSDTTSARKILSWLLCEAYDASGNAIIYCYKAENTEQLNPESCFEIGRNPAAWSRARYIKSIKYGNRVACRDNETWDILPWATVISMDWMFEIVFDYGEHQLQHPGLNEISPWNMRQDVFSSYRSGFEIRMGRLCRRVLMFHHLPERIAGVEYCLVSSTTLEYRESPTATFLESVTFKGHIQDSDGDLQSQALAPLSFEYTHVPDPSSLQLQSTQPKCLQTLPISHPDSVTQWIDLNSEGLTGILVQASGVWYYQRNENAAHPSLDSDDGESSGESDFEPQMVDGFGPIQRLPTVPNFRDNTKLFFQDIEGEGSKNIVVLDHLGRLESYHTRLDNGDWTMSKGFAHIPNINLNDQTLKQIDLTGDGRADILTADALGQIIWYKSLGIEGFGPPTSCKFDTTRGRTPKLLSVDEQQAIYLADMSGDGLLDIVQISNGCISYWPNMGLGMFGGEVLMGNLPLMDCVNIFNQRRVRLLDIDGSGTTDLIYLPPSGGVVVYFNQCGNMFSPGKFISCFPPMDNLSAIFVADILGNGTSCLCWVGPDGTTTNELTIFYLDIAAGRKPHLLSSYTNNVGLKKSIAYRSSTKFYLQDERRGQSWRTKLPFPVHVVSKVLERDLISLTTCMTKYRYHDGYYDKQDHEFRGFGNVEEWKTESYFINGWNEKPYKKPVLHTILWFFVGSTELGFTLHRTFNSTFLATILSTSDSVLEYRDTIRALKGRPIRTEVYGLDGSPNQDVPYFIEEYSYEVITLQHLKPVGKPGIQKVLNRESITATYERCKELPRLSHMLFLEHNSHGQVTKTVTAQYGLKVSHLSDQRARACQETNNIEYLETIYTNDICTQNEFYGPLISQQRKWRISGLPADKMLSVELLRRDNYSCIHPTINNDGSFSIVSESRCYYRSQDMKQRLQLGHIEPFSVVDQTFELVLTPKHVELAYGVNDERLYDLKARDILEDTGHVEISKDGYWWAPSSRSIFTTPGSVAEISVARQSFYTPTIEIDVFGNVSIVKMDELYLLPVESTDAAGNVTKATYDYRHLKPVELVDCNRNRTMFSMDAFGSIVAISKMGNEYDNVGDLPIESYSPILKNVQLSDLIQGLTPMIASEILGGATSRRICSQEMLNPLETSGGNQSLPRFQLDLSRSRHLKNHSGDGVFDDSDILINLTYFDGRGHAVQEVNFANHSDSKISWAVTKSIIPSSTGHVLKSHREFFTQSHLWQSHVDVAAPASMEFLDALDCRVGSLHANGSWDKSVITPWAETIYSAGSLGDVLDPSSDTDLGYHFKQLKQPSYLPSSSDTKSSGTKLERESVQKSRVYLGSLMIHHKDSNLRTIMIEETGGSKKRVQVIEYDIQGNSVLELDSLGRQVQRNQFDLLRNKVSVANMDSGRTTTIYDCMGNPVIQSNDRGILRRIVYDLRRATETWIRDKSNKQEYLWAQILYGERVAGVAASNLRGHVAEIRDQSGIHRNIRYDFKGNCVESVAQFAADYKSTLDWSQRSPPTLEPALYSTTTQFDALDRPYISTDALGHTTRRHFDPLGGVSRVFSTNAPNILENQATVWECHIDNITYAADARPLRIEWGNGVETTYTYDSETGQICTRKSQRKTDGTVLENLMYTYDIMGRLHHLSNSAQQRLFFRNCVADPSCEYWYDSFGRLVQATGREMVATYGNKSRSWFQNLSSGEEAIGGIPSDGQSLAPYTETYVYDDADNLLSMQHESLDAKTAGWSRKYHYEEASLLVAGEFSNRLSYTMIGKALESYGYNDDAGRLGCITQMPGYSRLGWDCNSRLQCSARQIQNSGEPEITWYVYDINGNRVRKVTERSTVDGNSTEQKLKETLYIGTAEIYRKYASYLAGYDNHLALEKQISNISRGSGPMMEEGGLLAIFEKDILGTNARRTLIRYRLQQNLEVDNEGCLISYEEYTPWGNSVLISCRSDIEAPSSYRYSAYRRDNETGLYHCGARYYIPWLGRWMSPDPLSTFDGLNVYQYVGDDPINHMDPTRLCKSVTLPALNRHNANNRTPANHQTGSKKQKSTHLPSIPQTQTQNARTHPGSKKSQNQPSGYQPPSKKSPIPLHGKVDPKQINLSPINLPPINKPQLKEAIGLPYDNSSHQCKIIKTMSIDPSIVNIKTEELFTTDPLIKRKILTSQYIIQEFTKEYEAHPEHYSSHLMFSYVESEMKQHWNSGNWEEIRQGFAYSGKVANEVPHWLLGFAGRRTELADLYTSKRLGGLQ